MKTEQQVRDRISELVTKLKDMDKTRNYEYWQDYQEEQHILYWVLDD